MKYKVYAVARGSVEVEAEDEQQAINKAAATGELLESWAYEAEPLAPPEAEPVATSGSRWPAFETVQDLKCLFCEATIRAVPAPLRGNRYRKQQWYTNGLQETARLFALCPKHQGRDHHEEAWRWARGEKDNVGAGAKQGVCLTLARV